MAKRRVNRELWFVARHEATHAVVAWLLDHPVRVVLIGPDAGETQPLDRTSPEDDLLIALAGVLGDPTAPPGMLCDRHVGDLVNIVRSAARICPDDPEPAIRKQALVVSNILSWRRVRRAIEAVARPCSGNHARTRRDRHDHRRGICPRDNPEALTGRYNSLIMRIRPEGRWPFPVDWDPTRPPPPGSLDRFFPRSVLPALRVIPPCAVCGVPRIDHSRCQACGILVGPGHVEATLTPDGLCRACTRYRPAASAKVRI